MSNQQQSAAISSNQQPSEAIGCHLKPPEAIGSHRKPSEAISSAPRTSPKVAAQSEAIGSDLERTSDESKGRGSIISNQKQSRAHLGRVQRSRLNHEQSEAISSAPRTSPIGRGSIISNQKQSRAHLGRVPQVAALGPLDASLPDALVQIELLRLALGLPQPNLKALVRRHVPAADQVQSVAIRSKQVTRNLKESGAISRHQKIECNPQCNPITQKSSEAIRSHPKPPEAIRSHPKPPQAIWSHLAHRSRRSASTADRKSAEARGS